MKHLHLLFLIIIVATGCEQKQGSASYTEAERQTVETIVRSNPDIESLSTLANNYKMSGNMLGQIVTLRYLGKVYREHSLFTEAIQTHRQGLELATAVADTLEMIQAYNGIGTNYRRIGALEEAATAHQQAVLLSAQMADQTSDLAMKNRLVSLNGMGNVLMSLGNLERADSIFRLALQGEHLTGNELGQAINLANIGSIKKQLGQPDSAYIYFNRSLQMNEKAGSNLGIALCHIHFGELNEDDNQLSEALNEYQMAHDLLSHTTDEWHNLDAVLNIARIYIKQGKTADARTFLDMASQDAERIGSKEHQVKVYELYYLLYERTGNLRQALDNYMLMTTLSDSLVNMKKLNSVQNQQLATERVRQQHEVQLTEEKLAHEQKEKAIMFVAIIAILLMALAIIGLMWNHMRTRASKQRMAQRIQNDRAELYASLTSNFQTPLSLIIQLGQQLEKDDADDSAKVRTSAKLIVRQGKSLMTLIEKMRGLSDTHSNPPQGKELA